MVPDPWLGGIVALELAAIAFMAILSSLETAVLNGRRSRLPQDAPPRRLAAAEAVLEGPEAFQASAHLAKSLGEAVVYGSAVLLGLEAAMHLPGRPIPDTLNALLAQAWPGIMGSTVLAYFVVTLLTESVSKALAARAPERMLLRWSGFIRIFTLLFTPLLWISSRVARALASATGCDPATSARAAHSEEEIILLVEGSAEEGVLEEEEKEMIHSIIEFTETVARQVMVPRIDIHAVEVNAKLDDVVSRILESGHSRLPVYEDTLDTVVGIVHVKDLLPALTANNREAPIQQFVREPYFVPEGKKIDELLQEFRRHKGQMAIVVDEFGGTSGLVTVEDVLEEIVGEIEDEYDVDEAPAAAPAPTGEGTLVDARMSLDDVNEELGFALPEGDYETLGGFVFSLFGHPPEVGERVSYDGLEFVAEAVDGLRLQKIRVLSLAAPEPPEETAS